MAQPRPLDKATAMLLHPPKHNVVDALELVRLACLERDIAMDEAATSIAMANRLQVERDNLRDEMKPCRLKTPFVKKARDNPSVMLNLDFILGVFRDKLGVPAPVVELKRLVLEHATGTSTRRHAAMFKTTLEELADTYTSLADSQRQLNELKVTLSKDAARTIEAMERELADRKCKVLALEAHNATLERANSDLTSSLASLRQEEMLHQATTDALEVERDELKAQLEAQGRRIIDNAGDTRHVVLSLQSDLDHQRQAFDLLNTEWSERYNAQSQRIEQLQAETIELNRTIEWLEDALDQERTTTIHFKNELQKALAAADTMQQSHMHELTTVKAQRDAIRLQLDRDECKTKCISTESKRTDRVAATTEAFSNQTALAVSLKDSSAELQNQVKTLTCSNHEHKAAADILAVHLAMHVRHWKRHVGDLAVS
ncbi:hypothetical protein H310_11636 [Aphanomyces invadans]|uniref:Uncharacterized protein n=1 Tax=Aphanomyces invadans TaxID=157072 RepID=A0A024TMP9_9STRA|nr:hypothetical protein H310_11636 [Aphanomyces invadans]ETV94642.1 hypothetical protein H310_11636 [Aphanomyces invadans]|eukprot:XP_008876587.1 hypothetical protein H310_11636 [Aphanomyces invadans]